MTTPKRDYRESRLQATLVTRLKTDIRPGVFFCSIPNESDCGQSVGARLKGMGLCAGAPDLLFVIAGKAHGLELKAAADPVKKKRAGRQSPAQMAVEAAWQDAGGVYEVATGIDEAWAVLTRWGALKGRMRDMSAPSKFQHAAEAAE